MIYLLRDMAEEVEHKVVLMLNILFNKYSTILNYVQQSFNYY